MSVDKLNHFALTNPGSIYDEEAMTSLRLVGRVAYKLNELIQAFHDLEKATNGTLTEFRTETIPEEVANRVQALIDNGSFDKAIDLYAGELIARLNNIFNNTTADKDVEIIDARMDHRGYLTGQGWPSLGAMLRFWLAELEYNLEAIITWQTRPVSIKDKMILGYVDTEGQYIKNDLETHKCATVEVYPGEKYRIKNIYGFSMPSFVVQDADHYVLMMGDTSEDKAEANYERVITMPANAAYLIVNSMNGYFAGVQQVIGCNSNALDGDYISNALAGVMCGNQKRARVGGKKVLTAHALKNGEIVALESGDTSHRVGRYNVKPGKAYTVNTACSFGCNPYVFLNADGSVIGKPVVAPEETEKSYAVTVRAPVGAAEMLVYFSTDYDAVLYVDDGVEVSTPSGSQFSPNLKGVKCHVIGDSISEVNSYASKRWYDYITEKTGLSFTVDAVGGSGYFARRSENLSFLPRVENIPVDSDVVVLFGSGNDLSALRDIGADVREMPDIVCETIMAIKDNCPGLPVVVVTPSPWKGYAETGVSSLDAEMLNYASEVQNAADLCGVWCVTDLTNRCPFTPNNGEHIPLFFSRDETGVHPDENGHKLMAPIIFDTIYKAISTF